MNRRMTGISALILTTIGSIALSPGVPAQQAEGGPAELSGHPPLDKPAELTREQAIDFYESIVDRMQRGYALSREPAAIYYRKWHLYNDAPDPSHDHGDRYVNTYANLVARRGGYGRLPPGERLPPGSIIAMDSLTVTGLGERLPGALFIMEKLRPGTSPSTADWRYVMIMPDGSYFGDTLAATADNVKFCYECHKQRAASDYIFFLPKSMSWSAAAEE